MYVCIGSYPLLSVECQTALLFLLQTTASHLIRLVGMDSGSTPLGQCMRHFLFDEACLLIVYNMLLIVYDMLLIVYR